VANKMADKKKTTSRSQMAEPRPRTSEKVATVKSEKVADVKATPREENKGQPKKVLPAQESKSTRRSGKSKPSALQRFRNGRIGRFMSEAYYELRHKVTWPTFEEARNMTVVVVVISVVIGAILGLVDYGLYNLFLVISGR
jgi:preprotein translocase SecE subunit